MHQVVKQIINIKGFWIWLIIVVVAWMFDPPAVPWLLVLGISGWLLIRKKNKTIELEREDKRILAHKLHDTKRKIAVTDRQLSRMEKMAMLGELTAGIAHELKNPINYVASSAGPLARNFEEIFLLMKKYQNLDIQSGDPQLMKDINVLEKEIDLELTINESRELIKGIQEGANRTMNIVKELRDFSREDEKEIKPANIHEAIDSTLSLLNNRTKGGIKIVKDYDPELKDIHGYPAKLKQVFMNILDNAIDAMNGEGEIRIKTLQSGQFVKIVISDTGHGIPSHVKEHIFEPFFSTKKDEDGTGLGLYISRRIIERHKGYIKLESQTGKGTTFNIWLPAA